MQINEMLCLGLVSWIGRCTHEMSLRLSDKA